MAEQIKLVGTPTVLVVDDEELMREVVSIMIEENGGRVITAIDGQDAVDIFARQAAEIDLVFLDFSMPRRNGYEAYLELLKLKPDVRVVMVSGLTITSEVEKLRKQGAVQFLSKPFHEQDLIKALRAAQERPAVNRGS